MMAALIYTSVLILLRLSGLIFAAPGGRSGSLSIRLSLAVGISLVIVPGQMNHLAAVPESWFILTAAVLGEFLLGVALGLGVSIVFSALTMAGKLIANTSGLSSSEMFDPFTGETNNPIGQFLFLMAASAFLLLDGHHKIIESLLATFNTYPAGTIGIKEIGNYTVFLTDLIASSFSLGLQISLSIITAILIAITCLAVVSRTLPTINLMTVGLPLNAMLAFGILFLSFGAIISAFCNYSIGVF